MPATWRPDELGLPRAVLLSCVTVALLIGGLTTLLPRPHPRDVPPPITVRLIELQPEPPATWPDPSPPDRPSPAPAPTPPEAAADAIPELPPETVAAAVPPPKPGPVAVVSPELAKPTPVLTPRIAPPLVTRPVQPHPLPSGTARADAAHRPVAPVASALAPPMPVQRQPAPPADTTSGIGPYRAGLHTQIERNLLAGADFEPASVPATALIEAVIEPEGRVMAVRIVRGSGVAAIDRAALAAVQRGGFRPFGPHMPGNPITISVPITVAPG